MFPFQSGPPQLEALCVIKSRTTQFFQASSQIHGGIPQVKGFTTFSLPFTIVLLNTFPQNNLQLWGFRKKIEKIQPQHTPLLLAQKAKGPMPSRLGPWVLQPLARLGCQSWHLLGRGDLNLGTPASWDSYVSSYKWNNTSKYDRWTMVNLGLW